MSADLPPPEPPAAETAPAPSPVTGELPQASVLIIESHGFTYHIVGSPLLTIRELTAILEAAHDAVDAVALLNDAYRRAGYLFGGAAIEDAHRDGVVRIRLSRQSITETAVPDHLSGYFSGLAGREALTRPTLLRKLVLAEAYAGRIGRQPRIDFEPAPDGGVRAVVTEQRRPEARPFTLSFASGNYGNRYAGRWTAQAGLAVRPGGGTEWTASYTTGLPGMSADTRGSRLQVLSGGVSVVTPWGIYGLGLSDTEYRVGNRGSYRGQHEGFDLYAYEQGRVRTLQLNGEQIAHAGERSRITLSQSYTLADTRADSDIYLGEHFVVQQEARRERYDYAGIGITYTARGVVAQRSAGLSANLQYEHGLSERSGSFEKAGIEPRFSLWRARISYQQALPERVDLSLSLSGQWTGDALPQNQQLSLGGFGTLTAWMPGVATGDRGGLARAGLSRPVLHAGSSKLSLSLFYETGYVRNRDVAEGLAESQSLSDIGVGIIADSPGGQFNIGYAHPLTARGVDRHTRDTHRPAFFLNLSTRW